MVDILCGGAQHDNVIVTMLSRIKLYYDDRLHATPHDVCGQASVVDLTVVEALRRIGAAPRPLL